MPAINLGRFVKSCSISPGLAFSGQTPMKKFSSIFYFESVHSLDVQLESEQGGLLREKTIPGSMVEFNGKNIRIDRNGNFIIGFSRNAPPDVILKITYPDGQVQKRKIKISQREYQKQYIEGLPKKKVTPSEKDLRKIAEDRSLIRGARSLSTSTDIFLGEFIWPLRGTVTGVFGSQRILNGKARSPHLGIDIAAEEGTAIVSPAPGRIVLVEEDMFLNGKTIMIDHGFGLTSIYAHLSEISVIKGELIEKGEMIGKVGMTGRSTGAHLHWGVHWYNIGLDPGLLLDDF